jgi:hypothetical protein
MRHVDDKYEQHNSSFSQTITSNELDQRSCKRFLHVFGWISSLLIDDRFGRLLNLVLVGQGSDREEVSLSCNVEELV